MENSTFKDSSNFDSSFYNCGNNISMDDNSDDVEDFSYHIYLVGSQISDNTFLKEQIKNHLEIYTTVSAEHITEHDIIQKINPEISKEPSPFYLKSIFVIDNFETPIFELLKKNGCRILGPTCVIDLLARSISLWSFSFTGVYSLSLVKAIIVFSGFENKSDLSRMTRLAHFMGARIKLEINKSVTHLVARDVRSSLYEDSVALGIDVVSAEWLQFCWKHRQDSSFIGTSPEVTALYHIKPFTGLTLAFHAFSSSDLKQMEQIAIENGALVTHVDDPIATHIIVEETGGCDFYIPPRQGVWLVNSQWFWKSVQFQVTYSERIFALPRFESKKKKLSRDNSPSVKPIGPDTFKKSPLASLFGIRRKSREQGNLSETTPHSMKYINTLTELINTERNYVDIIRTLLEVFRDGLDSQFDHKLGPLMSKEELKIIFGSLPEILNLHNMLLNYLEDISTNLENRPNLGVFFEKHVDVFLKVYSPFINYFEIIKETVEKKSTDNQRFHAFLKCCQADPRCKRQTLSELLIRPVQRLPSIILILKELLKNTTTQSPDLQKAIDSLTFVLNHINEDKRRTTEQLQMVEIFNDIEECPAYVMSSNRHFLFKTDAYEFQEIYKHRSRQVTLFVMSDSIEFARKRHYRIFRPNSPAPRPINPTPLTRNRSFKHCYYLPFKNIDRIIEVPASNHPLWRFCFGLHFKNPETDQPTTFFYQIIGDSAQERCVQIVDLLTRSIACAKSVYDIVSAKSNGSNSSSKGNQSPISSLGRVLENLALKASRRMSRAFSTSGSSLNMPRSISVTSQITTDSILSPTKFSYRSRKSTFDERTCQSADFENLPLKNPQIPLSPKQPTKGEKGHRGYSLWRRSIQSTDPKR